MDYSLSIFYPRFDRNVIVKFLSYLFCSLSEHKRPKLEVKSDVESAKEDSVDEDDHKLVIKEEQDSQNELEEVNQSAASSCDYNLSQFKDEPDFEADESKSNRQIKEEEEDSDEDMPLVCSRFCSQCFRFHAIMFIADETFQSQKQIGTSCN